MATTPMSGDGDFRPKPVVKSADTAQKTAASEGAQVVRPESAPAKRDKYDGFAPAENFGHPHTWE